MLVGLNLCYGLLGLGDWYGPVSVSSVYVNVYI